MGWMQGLPDNRTLRNIVIPGSHDAGLWRVAGHGFRSSHVVTQTHHIGNQLESGCRLFDFRIFNYNAVGRTTENDLRFGHFAEKILFVGGRGNSMAGRFGPKLVTALQHVSAYLNSNPHETVILRFSHINASNRPHVVAAVKKHLAGCLYKNNGGGQINLCTIPLGQQGTVGSLRGKVLAIFDRGDGFTREPDEGIFTYRSFKCLNDIPRLTTDVDLHLCGEYSDKSGYDEMETKQEARRQEHRTHVRSGNDPHLHVCYFTLTSGVKNILEMTRTHWPKLPGFLDKMLHRGAAGSSANVVMMDFINRDRCNRVIRRGNSQVLDEAHMSDTVIAVTDEDTYNG